MTDNTDPEPESDESVENNADTTDQTPTDDSSSGDDPESTPTDTSPETAEEATGDDEEAEDIEEAEGSTEEVEEPAVSEESEKIDAVALVDRAEKLLTEFLELDEEDEERTREIFEKLSAVATESEELLATINIDELPDSIDMDDVSDISKAFDEEELSKAETPGDLSSAVDYRKLITLIDLAELWEAVDVREFWRNQRELKEAVDDLVEQDVDGDDGPNEGMFDLETSDDDAVDDAVDGDADEVVDEESDLTPDLGPLDTDESRQAAIQTQVSDSVDEFRKGILEAHERLESIVEANKKRTNNVGQPDSRNPSAYSTLPPTRSSKGSATGHSTVPEETRYSSAPNRRRIYGRRFDDETEDDDD